MNEMMGYIFGSLRANEMAVKSLRKAMKHQVKFNRAVIFFMAGIFVEMRLNDLQRKAQEEKIEELAKEVEALKNQEGENDNA